MRCSAALGWRAEGWFGMAAAWHERTEGMTTKKLTRAAPTTGCWRASAGSPQAVGGVRRAVRSHVERGQCPPRWTFSGFRYLANRARQSQYLCMPRKQQTVSRVARHGSKTVEVSAFVPRPERRNSSQVATLFVHLSPTLHSICAPG